MCLFLYKIYDLLYYLIEKPYNLSENYDIDSKKQSFLVLKCKL